MPTATPRTKNAETHESQADRLLSPKELARILGLGRTSTYALLDSGALPTYRIGHLRKVRQIDVEAFIESLRERP